MHLPPRASQSISDHPFLYSQDITPSTNLTCFLCVSNSSTPFPPSMAQHQLTSLVTRRVPQCTPRCHRVRPFPWTVSLLCSKWMLPIYGALHFISAVLFKWKTFVQDSGKMLLKATTGSIGARRSWSLCLCGHLPECVFVKIESCLGYL